MGLEGIVSPVSLFFFFFSLPLPLFFHVCPALPRYFLLLMRLLLFPVLPARRISMSILTMMHDSFTTLFTWCRSESASPFDLN